MAIQVIAVIGLILTITWGVLKYLFNPKRKVEFLEREITKWEQELSFALNDKDSARITIAMSALARLQKSLDYSARAKQGLGNT